MYLKPEVEVDDWGYVEQFLAEHPLGLLTTCIPLPGQPTLQASHVPFIFEPPPSPPVASSSTSRAKATWSSDGGDLGVMRCHLARMNPQAKALLSVSDAVEEVLVVFGDAANQAGYISPQWYVETKPATGKTVPTWNYAELQLYGRARIMPTHDIVTQLSDRHEHRIAELNPDATVWKVTDAPESYIQRMHGAIIGLEIQITSIGCKLKMSRDKSPLDRKGVLDGLRSLNSQDANSIADTIQHLGPYKKPDP